MPDNPVDTTDVFDEHVAAWNAWQDSPWGRLRYQLVARLLAPHLADLPTRSALLDVGGGDGADSVPLADRLDVTVVDQSTPLLAQAERRAARAGAGPIRVVRASLGPGLLQALGAPIHPGGADAVLCHNVVPYGPDLDVATRALASCARPRALITLMATNPVNHVLRTAARDLDPGGALAMLDASTFHTVTFDHDVRRITWQQGVAALEAAGCEIVDRYGILCVNHLITDDDRKHEPEFAADLQRLELALANLDPYRDIAAFWLLIARRR
jgi:S-adenosylmethionine-dependent methyltransferase